MSNQTELLITPSMLAADWSKMNQAVGELYEAGCKLFHLDIMDGHFVPNLTFGPQMLVDLAAEIPAKYEAHLMVNRTEFFVDLYNLDCVETILIHVESTTHLHRELQRIQAMGKKSGVVYNPATPIDGIEFILPHLDQVLFMTVNPGFGGQKYIREVEGKIRELRKLLKETGREDVIIEADGGIAADTLADSYRAGLDYFVMGTAVMGAESPGQSFQQYSEELQQLAQAEPRD